MATSMSEGVVTWPVEPGSEFVAPIRYAAAATEGAADTHAVVWLAGFGERGRALQLGAQRLSEATGCVAICAELPFGRVGARASNVAKAFDYLTADAPHHIAKEVAPDKQVLLGGNSRGGAVAIRASRTGPCEAVGALSPMGITNEALGRSDLGRGVAMGRRLIKTSRQYSLGEGANWRTVGGVLAELGQLASRWRLKPAVCYGMSTDLQEALLEDVRERTVPLRIFVPGEDLCFGDGEYTAALGKIGCCEVLHAVDGPHGGIGNSAGEYQLEAVGQWLASVAKTA